MNEEQALQDDDLVSFLKTRTPNKRRSLLAPYKEQILYLKKQGFTEPAILDFLKEKKNVKVSQPTLNAFIKKHKNPKMLPADNNKSVATQEAKTQQHKTRKNTDDSNTFKLVEKSLEELLR